MQFKVKMLSYITQPRQGRNYGEPLVVTGSIAPTWMGRKYGERTQTNIKHNKHSQENLEQFIPAPPPGESPPQPPPENLGECITAPLPQENLEERIPASPPLPPSRGESRGVHTRPSAPPCIQKLKNH